LAGDIGAAGELGVEGEDAYGWVIGM